MTKSNNHIEGYNENENLEKSLREAEIEDAQKNAGRKIKDYSSNTIKKYRKKENNLNKIAELFENSMRENEESRTRIAELFETSLRNNSDMFNYSLRRNSLTKLSDLLEETIKQNNLNSTQINKLTETINTFNDSPSRISDKIAKLNKTAVDYYKFIAGNETFNGTPSAEDRAGVSFLKQADMSQLDEDIESDAKTMITENENQNNNNETVVIPKNIPQNSTYKSALKNSAKKVDNDRLVSKYQLKFNKAPEVMRLWDVNHKLSGVVQSLESRINSDMVEEFKKNYENHYDWSEQPDDLKKKVNTYINKYLNFILTKKKHLINDDLSKEGDTNVQILVAQVLKYFADNISVVSKSPSKKRTYISAANQSPKELRNQPRVNYKENISE